MSTLTQPDQDHDDPQDAPEAVGAPGSVLENLRRRREQLAAEEPRAKFLAVPGYQGALVIEYRWPDGGSDALIDAVARAQGSKAREAILNANADVLVRCCHQIHGQQPGGEREPLDPDPSRPPLKFGKRLAELLQIDLPDEIKSPARHVCRHVFSPRAAVTGIFDGDLALIQEGGRVGEWLTNVDEEASDTFVGE